MWKMRERLAQLAFNFHSPVAVLLSFCTDFDREGM